MATLTLSDVPNANIWHEALALHAGATAFHRWDFLAAAAPALHCEFRPLGVYREGQLVGLCPLMLRQRGPFRIANWLPFPYVGPLLPLESMDEALVTLRSFERENRVAIIQMAIAPCDDALDARRELFPSRFEVTSEQTCFLELRGRSEEDVFKDFHRRARRAVRKAEAAQAVSRPITREDLAERVPTIMEETFGVQGRASDNPPESALAVWDALAPTGAISGVTVWIGDTMVAFALNLEWDGRLYGWLAGGLRAYRDSQATSLAYWETMKHAMAKGLVEFDMVGTPTPAITEFKLGFGAELRPFVVARSVNSRAYAIAQRAHNTLAQLRHRFAR